MDEDVLISSYESEPWSLEYLWEGKVHRYVPDFLVHFVDGRKELREIGVKILKESERNQEKFVAAKGWVDERKDVRSFKVVSY